MKVTQPLWTLNAADIPPDLVLLSLLVAALVIAGTLLGALVGITIYGSDE